MIYIHILHTDFSFQDQQIHLFLNPFSIFSLVFLFKKKRINKKIRQGLQNPIPETFQIANLPNGRRHLTCFCIAGCFPGVDVGPDAGPGTLGSSGRRGGSLRSRGVVSGHGAQLYRGEHREFERLGTGGRFSVFFGKKPGSRKSGFVGQKTWIYFVVSNTCGEKQFLFETCVFFVLGGRGTFFFVFEKEEFGKGVRRCFLMSEGLENLRNLTYPICSVLPFSFSLFFCFEAGCSESSSSSKRHPHLKLLRLLLMLMISFLHRTWSKENI